MEFSSCGYREGALGAYTLLNRLTVLREPGESPASAMEAMLGALLNGDMLACDALWHRLIRSLLDCPARRVSGGLWKDYLIYLVTQRENVFSSLAAARRTDEELMAALRRDLALLGRLSELGAKDILRMAQESYREHKLTPRQPRDSISLMSAAVWSGSAKPLPARGEPEPIQPHAAIAPMDFEWMGWDYGESGLRDVWVSDGAAEELYARMCSEPEWERLADDLWSCFATCGSGVFLQHRLFSFDGTLHPLDEGVAAPLAGDIYEAERAELMQNVIRFMRGERAENMLLCGEPGVGKSAQIYSLPYELPEVRLIRMDTMQGLKSLFDALSAQPLNFLLFFDGPDMGGKGIRALANELCALHAQPENLLLAAAARGRAEAANPVFPLSIPFGYLGINEFMSLTAALCESAGAPAEPGAVRAACLDYQVDAREALTFAGARMVAYRLMKY